MKKFLYLAIAFAMVWACTKGQQQNVQSDTFKEGQVVTIGVTAPSQTKSTSSVDPTSGTVSFKWEDTDAIKVTVGSNSATFTVSKLIDGGTSAEFTGVMPASGSTFDVQFPVEDPTLTSQSITEGEALPHNMMKSTATNCTVDTPFSLTAANAVLRFNLWGTDKTISKIVVTNTTSSANPKPSYTLNVSPAVTLPSTEAAAKAFFVVVPAGNYGFSAEVFDNAATPAAICKFETSEAQTFTAGLVMKMGVKKVGKFYPGTELEVVPITTGTPPSQTTTVWAPVNCGYDATHKYGLLYQFGRKYGSGYDMTEGMQTLDDTTTDVSQMTDSTKFYANWTAYEWLPANDPCPEGWCVPTSADFSNLMGGDYCSFECFSVKDGQNGFWLDGTSAPPQDGSVGIFIPAAGLLNMNCEGESRETLGRYFTRTTNGSSIGIMFFNSQATGDGLEIASGVGHTVRCVQKQ